MNKNKLAKLFLIIVCVVMICGVFCSCNDKKGELAEKYPYLSDEAIEQLANNIDKENPIATLKIKDYGTVKIELYNEVAPNTVANFIVLANDGYYNGLTFHRIINNFMMQGGDPKGDGTGGPGYAIKGEFTINGIENKLSHTDGVISMGRRSMPYDSAGSQFFICNTDYPSLDGQYAAFGKVIEGLDVVHKASEVKTDLYDKPLNDVIIESIVVDVKGGTYTHVDKIS